MFWHSVLFMGLMVTLSQSPLSNSYSINAKSKQSNFNANLVHVSAFGKQTNNQTFIPGQFPLCVAKDIGAFCSRTPTKSCPPNYSPRAVVDTFADCCTAGDFPNFNDANCSVANGELRLVPAGQTYGFVEINYKGIFGTICDDSMDTTTAVTLCKLLGLPFANPEYANDIESLPAGFPNPGPYPEVLMWFDDFSCAGTETNAIDCSYEPFGEDNCGPDENIILWCK